MQTFRIIGRRARGLIVLMALLNVLTLGGTAVVLVGDARTGGLAHNGPLGTPAGVWILLGALCGAALALTTVLLRRPPELASDGSRLLVRGALDPVQYRAYSWDRIEGIRLTHLTRPAGRWGLSVTQRGMAENVTVTLAEFPLQPHEILRMVRTAAPPGITFDDADAA
jgi:hypothetical protein